VTTAAAAVWELREERFAAPYRRLLLALLHDGACGTGFGPLERFMAQMAALLGDEAGAHRDFEAARAMAEGGGPAHLPPLVDYDQACVLIDAGSSDRAWITGLLEGATDAFHSHGMLGWAARAAEQRARLAHASAAAPSPPASAPRRRPGGLTAREE